MSLSSEPWRTAKDLLQAARSLSSKASGLAAGIDFGVEWAKGATKGCLDGRRLRHYLGEFETE